MKELIKPLAEDRIVGSDRRQYPGMIKRRLEGLFEIPNPGDDFRIQQRVQVGITQRFLLQRIEAT